MGLPYVFMVTAASGGTVSQGYLVGKSRGATILNGGNISSKGPVTNAPYGKILGAMRQAYVGCPKPTVAGSRTVCILTGTTSVTGDWGVVRAGAYVMMGGNVTTKLANSLAYRALAGGSNGNNTYTRSIASRGSGNYQRLSTITIVMQGYTYTTPTVTCANSTAANFVPANATSGTSPTGKDLAATPTRALPGRVCYTINGRKATTGYYSARTD